MRPISLALSLALVSSLSATVLLSSTTAPSSADELSPDVQTARAALEKYQDPSTAIREGYLSTAVCVEFTSSGNLNGMPYPAGGMGVHFLNMGLVGSKLDLAHPQVLIYEPIASDKLRLAAAEWFVPYTKGMKAPVLFGRTFYGPMMGHYPVMPAELVHYDLHVWLWKQNPAGMFIPTNADIKCPATGYTLKSGTPEMAGMH